MAIDSDRDSSFIAKVQVDSTHYRFQYDDARRWSSYWWQLRLVHELGEPSPIVEIGVGNSVVGNYLREVMKMEVASVDVDPALKPDIVASIESVPVLDSTFDCAMACQVLEHLPYPNAEIALAELRRISKRAIISVPNANRFVLSFRVGFGSRLRSPWTIDLARFFPRPKDLPLGGQHYWELGRESVSVERFKASISDAGWKLARDFRNPDFPYHHFFVLE